MAAPNKSNVYPVTSWRYFILNTLSSCVTQKNLDIKLGLLPRIPSFHSFSPVDFSHGGRNPWEISISMFQIVDGVTKNWNLVVHKPHSWIKIGFSFRFQITSIINLQVSCFTFKNNSAIVSGSFALKITARGKLLFENWDEPP